MTVTGTIQPTIHPTTTELMTDATLVPWQWITVKETRLTGVCFLREHNLQTSENCFVLDLLQQPPEWNVLEVLVRPFAQVHPTLPPVVLAHNDFPNAVFQAVSDDELADVVKVVLQPEVPLPA